MIIESPPKELMRVTLVDEKLYLFEVTFILPQAPHYQGGEFIAHFDLSDNYPLKAPLIRFKKYNRHPLIKDEG